jgi:hypothetical protein
VAHLVDQLLVEQPAERLPAAAALEQLALERAVPHLLQHGAEERLADELAGVLLDPGLLDGRVVRARVGDRLVARQAAERRADGRQAFRALAGR